MKNSIEIEKIFYDGQKFTSLGFFSSLEAANGAHKHYSTQQTFEDIEELNSSKPYLHLVEYRNDEHYNDLYFIWG